MPELPEVEVTRRGIAPLLEGKIVRQLLLRTAGLRWPVPAELPRLVAGKTICSVERRGKYLILRTSSGSLLLHLGMSGSLRIAPASEPPARHDHMDVILSDGFCLRMHDPRRFGAVLWAPEEPLRHPLLAGLGPEPLTGTFSGGYLYARSRNRKIAVKSFIMESRVVAGLGNIYAAEALFRSGIHPAREAGSLSLYRYEQLAATIREVLLASIAEGERFLGTFTGNGVNPGYFPVRLAVYGRNGKPCFVCGGDVSRIRIGGRSTYLCARCQT